MDKFPTPGIHSCDLSSRTTVVREAELSQLAADQCQTSPLRKLHNILGKDADLHLVGGSLRDLALGQELVDFDLASRLTPAELQNSLQCENIRVIETGISHGTLTALIDDHPIEITTFRLPGSRESSVFSETIEQDLGGRDFTFNALAFSLNKKILLDPYKGLKDLADNVIRAVPRASDRFEEDPLRLLRLLRFGPAQGRSIDHETHRAALSFAKSLASVSIERIREELMKILLCDHAGLALEVMHELGLLAIVLPELIPAIGFEQNKYHIHDVFEHTLWVLNRSSKDPIVRLSALFHDIGKPASLTVDDDGARHFYKHEILSEKICKKVMERLKFSKSEIKQTSLLVRYHMRPLNCGDAGVRRIMRDLDSLTPRWLELKAADAPPLVSITEYEQITQDFLEKLEREQKRMQSQYAERLEINGDDLMDLGIQPGPRLGKILEELRDLVTEKPECNTREYLLGYVKEKI